MDIVERLAQQAAEAINGGEFNNGKWYTEGQRQAWRKAMTPAADEIERLRGVMEKVADILYDKGDYECWAALRNALWQQGEKE